MTIFYTIAISVLYVQSVVTVFQGCAVEETKKNETSKLRNKRGAETPDFATVVETPRYIEVSFVITKEVYNSLTADGYTPEEWIYDSIKAADKYVKRSELGVSIFLKDIVVWSSKNKFSVTASTYDELQSILTNFKEYRKETLLKRTWSDGSFLIKSGNLPTDTGGSAEGIFYVAGLCAEEMGSGILTYKNQDSASFGALIVHELGHGLWMSHDSSSTDADCCVMLPTVSTSTYKFSDESKEKFRQFVTSALVGRQEALLRKPSTSYIPSEYLTAQTTCGNGLVESWEQCDCGGGCIFGCCDCCDMQTCQFKAEKQCSEGECCDVDNCMFHGDSKTCRSTKHSTCDLQDTCTGNSNECIDKYAADGTACVDADENAGYCVMGNCLTHNQQCKDTFTDDFGVADDDCYQKNLSPDENFNCGPVIIKDSSDYPACSQDVDDWSKGHYKCGVLVCNKFSNPITLVDQYRSPFSSGSCVTVKDKYWNGKSGKLMVEDGTKCDTDKVCHNMRCIEKEQYFATLSPPLCGNGVVDDGEDCDPGESESDCCNAVKCTFKEANDRCTSKPNSCTEGCSGSSDQCATVSREGQSCDAAGGTCVSDVCESECKTSDDWSSCDNGKGLCLENSCRTPNMECEKLGGAGSKVIAKPFSKLYSEAQGKVAGMKYGGGGYLFQMTDGDWDNTKGTLTPLFNDSLGLCGMVLCQFALKSKDGIVYRNLNQIVPAQTAFVADTRMRSKSKTYAKFLPQIGMRGSPCCTAAAELGYCENRFLVMTSNGMTWSWYSKCLKLEESSNLENFCST